MAKLTPDLIVAENFLKVFPGLVNHAVPREEWRKITAKALAHKGFINEATELLSNTREVKALVSEATRLQRKRKSLNARQRQLDEEFDDLNLAEIRQDRATASITEFCHRVFKAFPLKKK